MFVVALGGVAEYLIVGDQEIDVGVEKTIQALRGRAHDRLAGTIKEALIGKSRWGSAWIPRIIRWTPELTFERPG